MTRAALAARRLASRLALALLLLAAGCAAQPPASAPRTTMVERAVDGDTLLLADADRVRLLGIDTPELRDASPVLRDLADAARIELARLVTGRSVRLEPHREERDRYGRLLAHVDVAGDESGTSVDVGERLLALSLARVYPTEHARLERYLAVEAEARAAARGVWAPEARRAWGPRAEIVIGPAAASAHLGKIARVEGRLTAARRTKKALFLTLEGGGASLKVVSFRPTFFPPPLVDSWMSRDVAATGKLKLYEGRPELIVEGPDQIEIPASDLAR